MQIFNQCPPVAATHWLVAWAPFFSALTATVFGGVTFHIARQQSMTARAKLRLDLYDKRWKVYEACWRLIMAVGSKDPVEVNQAYFEARVNATFLFGLEVNQYLDSLPSVVSGQARKVYRAREDTVAEDTSWRSETFTWERERLAEIEGVFAPYLRFKQRGERQRIKPFYSPQ